MHKKHVVAIIHGKRWDTTYCRCGATKKWHEPTNAVTYKWQHEQLNLYGV